MRSTALTMLAAAVLASCSPGPAEPPTPATTSPDTAARATASSDGPATATTTALTGNRVTPGELDTATDPVLLDPGFTGEALVAAPLDEGHLLVATDRRDVTAWVLGPAGVEHAPAVTIEELGTPPAEGRLALVRDGESWSFAPSSGPGDGTWTTPSGRVERHGDRVSFGAATVDGLLPDARWAVDGARLVVPVRPTDAYGHGVLGDAIEAEAIAVADAESGDVEVVDVPVGTVLEGTGVVLADIDGDDTADPVMTVSDDDVGARQVALVDDRFVAGPAVGTGNRWRHLIGVHEGRVVEVVTPHLTGVLQVLEADGRGGLASVVEVPERLASHAIGSRDLDMAALVDATGDGVVDALGPPAGGGTTLRVVDGTDGAVVADIALPGRQLSNLVVMGGADRRAVAAVATDDGTVVLVGIRR